MSMDDQLIDSWQKKLGGQFALPYMTCLQEFLASETEAGKKIYP